MTKRPLLVEPNAIVAGLNSYVIDRPGVDPDLVLDFNESLAPPPALAGAGMAINRYPDYHEIEAAIAAHLGIAPEKVVVTNGADDALKLRAGEA